MAAGTRRKGQTGKAGPQAEKEGLQRSIPPIGQAVDVLKKALPNTDPEVIGGFCASVFDLWETGQTLDKKMRGLLMFQFPRDRQRLHDTLIWISATQLDMASYWIDEAGKDLRKLFKALDKPERKPRSAKKR